MRLSEKQNKTKPIKKKKAKTPQLIKRFGERNFLETTEVTMSRF